MNFRSLAQLCIISSALLGCYETFETIELEDESENVGGNDPGFVEANPDPPSSPSGSQQEKTDKGFDACPSDAYVLWEKDGIKYVMTIEVFCDPIKNSINLGCPAPF